MACRNFWTVKDGKICKGFIEFKWESGISVSQKRRSCLHLHSALNVHYDLYPALDISSASPEQLGIDLSAFNLKWNGKTIECWYQGSKIYSNAGHMKHLYDCDSLTAKKSMKESNLGKLIGFRLVDTDYPMEPRTVFYDWIYLQGLLQYDRKDEILKYQVFTDVQATTDIDACQARAVCIYKLLHEQNNLGILRDFDLFKDWHSSYVESQFSGEFYPSDMRQVGENRVKILDTSIDNFKKACELFHYNFVLQNDGSYTMSLKAKVVDPDVIVYTDGLLDDLCALEELSKKYKKALIILVNGSDLPTSDYAMNNYDMMKFSVDVKSWFTDATVIQDAFMLSDVCELTPDSNCVVYCLCNATAISKDLHMLKSVRELHAMIGSSHTYSTVDEEWNAAQDIDAYGRLLDAIGNNSNWHQYTSVECEQFIHSPSEKPEQLKYYDVYINKMRAMGENQCCYDLKCIYMSYTI